MPRDKDLKRLVRARMRKTGEAYTTARAQLLRKPRTKKVIDGASVPPAVAAVSAVPPNEYAQIAGMSDAKIEGKTGRTWDRWVFALDHDGADKMSHREIAELVHQKYKAGDWWSQMVTVGYERIKGLRARGQRRDGSYEANKSRTYNVPVETLFDAWADATVRRRWMSGASVKVRTASRPKSMRIEVGEGGIVAIGFTPKGKSKSSVAVQHTKIRDRETADRLKQYWSERLDALEKQLK
ncbi:MAG TPA: hypothetical protein VJ596_03585 [Gemmatimonadaceae bacterium]|nr:hypothetical protein [Gemmatimonadaceae bacterium]